MAITASAAARTNVAVAALRMYRELEQMRKVLAEELHYTPTSDVLQAVERAQGHVALIHDEVQR
jgi:hypothetical protein